MNEVTDATWRKWDELPWMGRSPNPPEFAICLRNILASSCEWSPQVFFEKQLPDVAAEFAVPWVAVVSAKPTVRIVGEFGRLPLDELPTSVLDEVVARSAGVFLTTACRGHNWSLLAAPLESANGTCEILLAVGRGLTSSVLDGFMGVAQSLGFGYRVLQQRFAIANRVERLRATLRATAVFRGILDSRPLLELIAGDAARLLDCDRSSIFVWDRDNKSVVACPALGVDGEPLRFSDDRGIVGQCLKTGETLRIDDAYADPRFNPQGDAETGYTTHDLLCVPLIDPDGETVGVFEAINKKQGSFTDDDVECLRELGTHAAAALQNSRERERLARRTQQLTEQATQSIQIIGNSASINALRSTVDRLALTDLPVLILGESGTGKEVVAQALHFRSTRSQHPFIAVNCAALTETLLESELFGHEKGAFTDAREARPGKFELAAGGTLFLDEIGDMSMNGQAKLLRVLEQKVITRVGGSQAIRTTCRVIAATNRNLANAVRDRRFREDLYYRLSVVAVELPALRDRPEDILPLAEYFIEKFSRQAARRPLTIGLEARRRLQGHNWPGNVRELRNLMERVAFLCQRDRVEADDLAFTLSPEAGQDGDGDAKESPELADATGRFQEQHIRKIVRRVRGNMSEAARLLGLHRSNLYRKMRHLGMTDFDEATGTVNAPDELDD